MITFHWIVYTDGTPSWKNSQHICTLPKLNGNSKYNQSHTKPLKMGHNLSLLSDFVFPLRLSDFNHKTTIPFDLPKFALISILTIFAVFCEFCSDLVYISISQQFVFAPLRFSASVTLFVMHIQKKKKTHRNWRDHNSIGERTWAINISDTKSFSSTEKIWKWTNSFCQIFNNPSFYIISFSQEISIFTTRIGRATKNNNKNLMDHEFWYVDRKFVSLFLIFECVCALNRDRNEGRPNKLE